MAKAKNPQAKSALDMSNQDEAIQISKAQEIADRDLQAFLASFISDGQDSTSVNGFSIVTVDGEYAVKA